MLWHSHLYAHRGTSRLPAGRVPALTWVLTLLVSGATLACNDLSGLAGKQRLPAGIPDPNSVNTRAGALAAYQQVVYAFQQENMNDSTVYAIGPFTSYVLASGLLTDELQAGNLGGTLNPNSQGDVLDGSLVDTRQLLEGVRKNTVDGLYQTLHGIRNSANLAIGALAAYDSADSPALRGHLYALQGYSVLLLADLYCSGVPLSTLDFQKSFTYHAGSTTQQLYRAAVAKFDTAIALSNDSVQFLHLAQIGKGRAYLALAQYDSAAAAVSDVPTNYSYQFLVNWHPSTYVGGVFSTGYFLTGVTEADKEGTTGLPYLSSGDPRTVGQTWGNNVFGVPQYAPVKYGGAALGGTGSVVTPIVVADGIEARLIQAEAAYHGVATGQGDWLGQLNALRQTAPVPGVGTPLPDPLPPLSDPGASPGDTARIRLLFTERAYWLFLTGHRQGDLRRLIRNYGLAQTAVYPSGSYPNETFQQYGADVTAPIPTVEDANPLFTGCLSRGA